MEVGEAIIAVGGFVTTTAGAIGIWWIRISNKRHKQEMERLEAERKAKREDVAAERRNKKDSSEEIKFAMEAVKKELLDSRQQIHDMRDDVSTAVNRLNLAIAREARCQADLARAHERIDHLETRLEEEGIKIKRRPLSDECSLPPPDSFFGDNDHHSSPPKGDKE